MIGLVTLDEVLRFVSRSVVHIAFDPDIRNNFLHNDPANPPSFRIPFNVVAAHKYLDRKSTRLNSSHGYISYAVFCLKKKKSLIFTPSPSFRQSRRTAPATTPLATSTP